MTTREELGAGWGQNVRNDELRARSVSPAGDE